MDNEYDNYNWVQHKRNPYIQHNKLNSHFRCKKCRMDLGVNAGGAASHSQGAHDIRLDGTPIIKKVEQPKIISKPVESNELNEEKINIMPEETNTLVSEQRTEYRRVIPIDEEPVEDDPYYQLHQKIERMMQIGYLYKRAKVAGISKSDLRPLEIELGIEDEEERKKEKEKKKREFEKLDRMAMFCFLAAPDRETQNRIIKTYAILRSTRE